MKRIVIILALLLLAVGGWWGYQRYAAQQAAQESAAGDQEAVDDLENVIWASGNLEPVTWAALNPTTPGRVSAIHVAEGDRVEAGQLLVELDDGVLRSRVDQAQGALAEAEAALAKLHAGATTADVAAAQARLAAAEAAVARAAGAMIETKASMESAAVQVQMAQRQYAELASHPTAAEEQVAQADIAVAEATLKQAQAAYNLVRGNPQIGALPESRLLYEATAGREATVARAALAGQGATPEQLAVALSAIDLAKAQANAAESYAPGVEASVQAALADRAGAQAALDKVLEGATAEEIAMAEARVQSARAAVNAATAELALNQLTAPFAGQVGAVHVRPGELTAGSEDVLLLGDTSTMHIKTTDLRETDVVHVRVGMPVEVTFDALPNAIFAGTVTRVAPVSSTEKGSTNYTVYVDVPTLDENLRWGMTAFVNIQMDR